MRARGSPPSTRPSPKAASSVGWSRRGSCWIRSSRRRDGALVRVLIALPLLACAEATLPASPPERPNVLLYVVDTLRFDALPAYGNDQVDTPALDALAAEGAVVERAYAHAPWTRPSVASLLTGRYPDGHGVQRRFDALADGVPPLAEYLRDAGYATACISTNPQVSPPFGFDRGCQHFVESHDFAQVDPRGDESRTPSRAANRLAREWLDGVAEPFFLFVLSLDPHAPYLPPDRFDRYDTGYEGDLDGGFESLRRSDLGPRDVQHARALYHAEVSSNDAAFGELLADLKERGVYDRTLTIFTSDHGEEFWEHGQRGHGKALHEESIRVPLLLRLPGAIAAGQRVASVVQQIDVAPTVLELSGVEIPDELEGRSIFAPAGTRPPPFAYAALDENQLSQRTLVAPPWKLVWDDNSRTALVYDLAADPGELQGSEGVEAEGAAELWKRLGARMVEAARRDRERPESVAPLSPPLERRLQALGYGVD